MAGKPEADHFDRLKKAIAEEKRKKKSKSPNWDTREALLKDHIVGLRMDGWPFNEGIPRNRQGSFKIILSNGEVAVATLDLETQYRTEGIQWKTKRTIWPKEQVAAWMEV